MINLYLGVFPFLYMQLDRDMSMLLFVDEVPNSHCFHKVQDYVICRWYKYLSSIYVISADDSSWNVPNIVPVYWILVPTTDKSKLGEHRYRTLATRCTNASRNKIYVIKSRGNYKNTV
jgi:hypothetical protein